MRLLSNCASKKGAGVHSFAIEHPEGKCPYATALCASVCYAKAGQFPLVAGRHVRNFRAARRPGFAARIRAELLLAVLKADGAAVACCLHEKGDFWSVEYAGVWTGIMAAMAAYRGLRFYVYTRAWVNPEIRRELERIAAAGPNVRVNLSTDRETVGLYGSPQRIGDGLVTYLAVDDGDLPPPGVDLVFRNLRNRDRPPLERMGGVPVCPHESGLYVEVAAGGMPVRCEKCRICIDRSLGEWERTKGLYLVGSRKHERASEG